MVLVILGPHLNLWVWGGVSLPWEISLKYQDKSNTWDGVEQESRMVACPPWLNVSNSFSEDSGTDYLKCEKKVKYEKKNIIATDLFPCWLLRQKCQVGTLRRSADPLIPAAGHCDPPPSGVARVKVPLTLDPSTGLLGNSCAVIHGLPRLTFKLQTVARKHTYILSYSLVDLSLDSTRF